MKPTMNACKSGYLLKQGDVKRGWKQRFFVLTNDSLCYYHTEEEASRSVPKELIPFNDMSLFIDDVDEKQPRYCLKLVRRSTTPPGTPRTLTLCSFSQKERNDWYTEILLATAIALVHDRSWMGRKYPERKKSLPPMIGSLSPMVKARGMVQKCKRRLSTGAMIRPLSFAEESPTPPRSPLSKWSASLQWKGTSWSALIDHSLAI